ncbi:ParB/RepB/Spo0J family partition protein [Amycolatopsis sp.]|uniref:ParB/RepB/Spo0J family partition protein n=1 Tax=Amycolatopsis sp. TaxID=37632 RepID=UPI002D7EF6F6|nr:ParB/RepB/Spo0J family partition protein [Amycolatopsis sp.]HET6711356.1 ParB/RepB/Spo0J family partition protein [Amycolatopsis sp.]
MRLPIDALATGRSVRVGGEDAAHVRRLAALPESDLPPIVVQRATMQVIDGRHRVRAARLRGASHIDARLVGHEDIEAFAFALKANTGHSGLPLTPADRQAATAHFLSLCPQWSDRRIAATAGVPPRTVVQLRDQLGHHAAERVGLDGRRRPTDSSRRRRLVRELLLDDPRLSLRQAARATGLSPETVRAVRANLVADKDRPAAPQPAADVARPRRLPTRSPETDGDMLQRLGNDPALRSTEAGRALLRLLHLQVRLRDGWTDLVGHLPPHCHGSLAALARQNAVGWRALAEQLERDLAS